MTNRIWMTLCMAFLLVGPAFAQTPSEVTAPGLCVSCAEAPSLCAPEWAGAQGCCNPGQRYWLTAEGLVGWIQSATLPPLLTTSLPGTAQAQAGILGLSSTSVVLEGAVNDQVRGGVRFGGGYWLDCEHNMSLEAGFMFLGGDAFSFKEASTGDPILARPFFNAIKNKQDAQLIAFPGVSKGAVRVDANSDNFYEFHLDLVGNLANCCCFKLDTLLGYRFYNYGEGLRVGTTTNPLGGGFVPGTQLVTVDQFETQNFFNGIDFGLKGKFCWDNLSLDLLAKAAVGFVRQEVHIRGSQIVTVPGAPTLQNTGGLLALSSNIGNHNSGDWTIMPEFGGTLSYQLTCNWRLFAGYSVLIMSDVARASEQVDLHVNTNLLPPQQSTTGPSVPAFNLSRADVWVQTLSLGVEFSF